MADTRRGLGASFGYSKDGNRHIYRFRCGGLIHGIKAIFDESEARNRRGFYPHRLSSAQFSVTVLLNGYTEYRTFNAWMMAYAEHLLDQQGSGSLATMTVAVPGKKFLRLGVPTTGIGFGDHVGSMLWQPSIVFESANDPLERAQNPAVSYYKTLVANSDHDVRYFYPFSEQLSGNQAPSVYDSVVQPPYIPATGDGPGAAFPDSPPSGSQE